MYHTVEIFSIIVPLPSRHHHQMGQISKFENTYATYAKVKRVGGEGVSLFSHNLNKGVTQLF